LNNFYTSAIYHDHFFCDIPPQFLTSFSICNAYDLIFVKKRFQLQISCAVFHIGYIYLVVRRASHTNLLVSLLNIVIESLLKIKISPLAHVGLYKHKLARKKGIATVLEIREHTRPCLSY